MTSLDNARAVVQTWRSGEHRSHWAAHFDPASPPSEFTFAVAEHWRTIMVVADQAADSLLGYGALPSHATVTELRKIASQAANHANRAMEWADRLTEAEQEEA